MGATAAGRSSAGSAAAKQIGDPDLFAGAYARALVTAFDRVSAGGDIHVGDTTNLTFDLVIGGQGGTRVNARRVRLEERAAPFVPPPDFPALVAAVKDEAVVVLTGRPGQGKDAVILQLFLHPAPGPVTILRLDPTTDLSRLTCDELEPGTVLLLGELSPAAVDALDSWTLERLHDRLTERECRLGITTSVPVARMPTADGCRAFELAERADARAVYDRHLLELLLDRPDLRDQLNRQAALEHLLLERLVPTCTLRSAAQLARLVHGMSDDPQAAADRVRAQLDGFADEECAQWFRKLGDLKAHCFAVSLAVLDGLPRETVAAEAARLEKILSPAPDTVIAPPQPVNPFAAAASTSPALLRAQVGTERRRTRHGEVREQVMRYSEPGFFGRVLYHVWREHDWIRGPLTGWLRELGGARDLRVRVGAATAVGLLARDSFEFLLNEVVRPWATDDAAYVRDSAATAFVPLLEDRQMAAAARELAREWTESDMLRLRATAARVQGIAVGLRSPTASLRTLDRLCADEEVGVQIAVAKSYCELTVDSTPALSARVLTEVTALAADRLQGRRLVGCLAAFMLVAARGVGEAWVDVSPEQDSWPTAVLLSQCRPQAAPALTELLARSVVDRDLGRDVLDCLDAWAVRADADAVLRAHIVQLLTATGRTEMRACKVLARRAQLWAGRDGPAPVTGYALAQALS